MYLESLKQLQHEIHCIQLDVHSIGERGHVASQPMNGDGQYSRKDVLIDTDILIQQLLELIPAGCLHLGTMPMVSAYTIKDQALNVIPGDCTMTIVFPLLPQQSSLENKENLALLQELIINKFKLDFIKFRNTGYMSTFRRPKVSLITLTGEDLAKLIPLITFQALGSKFANAIRSCGEEAEHLRFGGDGRGVATATVTMMEIKGPTNISVCLDLRGSDNETLEALKHFFDIQVVGYIGNKRLNELEPLPGSEPPAEIKEEVIRDLMAVARVLDLQTAPKIVRAGEDAQVLQKAIEYVAMILYRSSGTCHSTSEDADPDDRANAARMQFLAAWGLGLSKSNSS